MPRRALGPNELLRRARRATPSPTGSGLPMSRQELAEAVNIYLWDTYGRVTTLDCRYIGKLERGQHRWPQAAYREALRAILGAGADAALGFYATRGEARLPQFSGEGHRAVTPGMAGDADGPHRGARVGDGGWGASSAKELIPYATELVLGGLVTGTSPQSLLDLVPVVRPEPAGRVGAQDVARIEATTSVFRDWDNRWGGGLSRAAVLAQLHWAAASMKHATFSSQAVRRRMLTALADLAGLAVFLCYDVTLHEQARALWMLGLQAAREAGDADLVGATLRQLAHQSLHRGHPDEALRLLRLAYAVTVDPAHHPCALALAEIAAYEGWCYAAAGRLQSCQRALGRAEDHFADADGEQPPPWLAHLDAPELAALRGHAYHVLATEVPQAAEHAMAPLREAIAARPDGYARSKTLNLIALSATYFQLGDDLDEAIVIGDQALTGVASLNSARTLDRLRSLARLTDRHLHHPAMPDFRARLARALTHA